MRSGGAFLFLAKHLNIGGALHHQSFWRCCQSMDNRLVMNKPQFQHLPEYNKIIPAYWSYYWEGIF